MRNAGIDSRGLIAPHRKPVHLFRFHDCPRRRCSSRPRFFAHQSLLAKAPEDQAQLNEFIQKGCPPPQRIWEGSDYAKAREMIEKGELPLPHAGDPVLSPILKRMINPANIEALGRTNGTPDTKFRFANQVGFNLPPLIALYQKAARNGEKVEPEIASLTALLVKVAAFSFSFSPEPSEQSADKRAESERSYEELGTGLMKMFDGMIAQLERGDWSETNDLVLVASLAENLPAVRAALPAETLKDFRTRLESCRDKAKPPELKAGLSKAIGATEGSIRLNT